MPITLLLYIFASLLAGVLLGWLLQKFIFSARYVSRQRFDQLHGELNAARIEAAGRLAPAIIAEQYVARDLYNAQVEQNQQISNAVEAERKRVREQQQTLLELTEESGEKISKAVLDQDYVPKESFDIVQGELRTTRKEANEHAATITELNTTLTELREREVHVNEKLNTFKTELESLHTLSEQKFRNLATEVLEEKKKIFVDENKKELSSIIDPLKTDLTQFKEKIEATRKEDIQDITSLKKEIDNLQKLNVQLSDDAKQLANALKADVKMQGNWGEDRLKMILEIEGLQQYIDYTSEETYRDEAEDRNRRPDYILRLPNGKHIIIDSKVSLSAYVDYFNAATPEEKNRFLDQHVRSVLQHIERLADKNYQSLAGLHTPDYVFLFIHVESALTLALNQQPEIFNNALKRKIVLITPTNLVATLKIVKILWQKENQVRNVEEIFRQCGELYNKFVFFLEHMDKIDSALQQATRAHGEAMNHLKNGTKKGNTIIGRFEAIKKLEAKTNKQIPDKYLREIDVLGDEPEVKVLSIDAANGLSSTEASEAGEETH